MNISSFVGDIIDTKKQLKKSKEIKKNQKKPKQKAKLVFIQQRPLAFRPLWPNLGNLSLLELTSYYEAENTWGKMNIW